MSMITCIARIKAGYTIEQAAQEVWEVFGRGGHHGAEIVEEHIGWVNTPVQEGYFRCAIDSDYSVAMRYVQEIDGADTCEVISVEDQGQEMYQVGTDESGGPVYLGIIAGVGMAAVEPVVEEG